MNLLSKLMSEQQDPISTDNVELAEIGESPTPRRTKTSKPTLVIQNQLVIDQLGLDGGEVELVEVLSEHESLVRQGDKQFVVGSDLLKGE